MGWFVFSQLAGLEDTFQIRWQQSPYLQKIEPMNQLEAFPEV